MPDWQSGGQGFKSPQLHRSESPLRRSAPRVAVIRNEESLSVSRGSLRGLAPNDHARLTSVAQPSTSMAVIEVMFLVYPVPPLSFLPRVPLGLTS